LEDLQSAALACDNKIMHPDKTWRNARSHPFFGLGRNAITVSIPAIWIANAGTAGLKASAPMSNRKKTGTIT
jgi:hypothetical protein